MSESYPAINTSTKKFKLKQTAFYPENDELVDIYEYSKGEILVDMQYYKMNKVSAINKAYVRKGVADRLMNAQRMLPEGYHLTIWDSWRPYEVQKSLYDSYFDSLKKDEKNKNLTEDELHQKAREFVSYPDKTKNPSYVHSSGGAVDLTITNQNGKALDMGTAFDDFSQKAYTDYFENNEENIIARSNRRLLYYVMTHSGFTNYPFEWWHFDYGDIFYASVKNEPTKYSSIFSL